MNKHKEWCRASSFKIAKLDSKTGQKLDEFDSIYQAAKELGDASKASNISKAINGQLKSCYGYRWVKLC